MSHAPSRLRAMSENRVHPTPTGYDVIKIAARKIVTLSPAAATVSVPRAEPARRHVPRGAPRAESRAAEAG